jgi:hypothetical protein
MLVTDGSIFDIIESIVTGGYQNEKGHHGGHGNLEETRHQAKLRGTGKDVRMRLSNGEAVFRAR